TGELALRRLDARPFDAEPEAVESCAGQHGHVLRVPVIEVACVPGRLAARSGLDVFPPPPVRVHVASLGLVGGDRGAEQEAVGESVSLAHLAECSQAPTRKLTRFRARTSIRSVNQRERSPWHVVNLADAPGIGLWRPRPGISLEESTYGRGLQEAELKGRGAASRRVTSSRRLVD